VAAAVVAAAVVAAAVAVAATTPPTIVVITAGTTTAGVATEGIAAAIIPAEAGGMIVVDGVAMKAEDQGLIAAPDKAAAARTVMVVEIVAIAPLRIIRPTAHFAAAGATLIKIRIVAIVMGTRAKRRIVTRTATAIRTRIAIRTEIKTKTGIVAGTGIRTRIRIRIRTKTEIVDAIDTIAVIRDTIATPSTTIRLPTNPGTTKTMPIAKAPTIEAIKTACLPEPTMAAADSLTIPGVRTSSGVGPLATAPSLAAETFMRRPIAMVSCEATRKAIRIGKGISAVGFFTASNCFRDLASDFESRANEIRLSTHEIVPG
jgi:hypothetical protein